MKKTYILLLSLLILSCSKEEPASLEFNCTDNFKVCDLARDNNDFGFSLFKNLHDKDMDGDLFISPFSISTALAMTLKKMAKKR